MEKRKSINKFKIISMLAILIILAEIFMPTIGNINFGGMVNADETETVIEKNMYDFFYFTMYESGTFDVSGQGPEHVETVEPGIEYSAGICNWTTKYGWNNIAYLCEKLYEKDNTMCESLEKYRNKNVAEIMQACNSGDLAKDFKTVAEINKIKLWKMEMDIAYEDFMSIFDDVGLFWIKDRPACVQGTLASLINWGGLYCGWENAINQNMDDEEIIISLCQYACGFTSTVGSLNDRWNSQAKLALDILNKKITAEEILTKSSVAMVYVNNYRSYLNESYDYTVLSDGTVEISKYKGIETEVVIPDTIDGKSVTIIGTYAFSGCNNLKSIEILDGLTEIKTRAFYHCNNLTKLILPDSVTNIGDNAFECCTINNSVDFENKEEISCELPKLVKKAIIENPNVSIDIKNAEVDINNYNVKLIKDNSNNYYIKIKNGSYKGLTFRYIDDWKITEVSAVSNNANFDTSDTNVWTKYAVTLTVNVDKFVEGCFEFSFDDGQTWQSDNSKEFNKKTDDIKIKVRDKSGRKKEYSETINLQIDGVAPVIKDIKEIVTIKKDGVEHEETVNLINGITYRDYKMTNERWADEEFYGERIGTIGQNPTVVATLLSMYGYNYTPKDIATELATKQNPLGREAEKSVIEELTENNVTMSELYSLNNDNKEKVLKDALQNGYPVIMGTGQGMGGSIICLLGIDSQNLVYCSDPTGTFCRNTKLPFDEIFNEWIINENSGYIVSEKFPTGVKFEDTVKSVKLVVTAEDSPSGLPDYAYSFDNGSSWNNQNYKSYTANSQDIIIKVKDKANKQVKYSSITINTIVESEEEYTITYNGVPKGGLNGNRTSYNSQTETFALNEPSKEGYEFIGWTGTDLIEVTKNVTIEQGSTGNREYTAHWEPKTVNYTIKYYKQNLDESGYEEDTTLAKNRSGNIGAKVSYNDLTDEEKTIEGFEYDTSNKNNKEITLEDGENVLNLYYKRKKYTLTVEKDSDINKVTYKGNEITQMNVKYGASITLNAGVNTETGYTITFDKWESSDIQIDNPNNNSITIPLMPAKPITVKANAKKTPINYTITYNLDEGSLEEGKTNPATYTIETNAFKLNNPSRTGYAFTGWTVKIGDEAQEEKQMEVTITKGSTENRTYTANWIKLGDIKGDDKITIIDLLLLKRHIMAGTKANWKLKGDKLKAADINNDGKVNIIDLLLLKRYLIKKNS